MFSFNQLHLVKYCPPFQKGNLNCSQCDGLEVVSLGLFACLFVHCCLTLCLGLLHLGENKCIRKEVINLRCEREFVQTPILQVTVHISYIEADKLGPHLRHFLSCSDDSKVYLLLRTVRLNLMLSPFFLAKFTQILTIDKTHSVDKKY